VVALGVGFVFGAIASSSWSTAKNECPTFMGCSAQALNDRNNAVTFATTSTVTVIAGGVLAVGGLALFLLFPKHSTTVGVNASGLVGHF